MTKHVFSEKIAGKITCKAKRLCALLLLAALVLSLTPAVFADGGAQSANKGELSITPTTILDEEALSARIVRVVGPEESRQLFEKQRSRSDEEVVEDVELAFKNQYISEYYAFPDQDDDWERFVVEMENRGEDIEYLYADSVQVNGKMIQACFTYFVNAGEKAEGYLMLNKTLLALAGISRIQTLKVSLIEYDEWYNEVRTKWVNVPVKDTRKDPYPAKAKAVKLTDYGATLTLLGMDQSSKVTTLFFKAENKSKETLEEFCVHNRAINGGDPLDGCLSTYWLGPKTTYYYMGYLIKTSDEPINTIDLYFEIVIKGRGFIWPESEDICLAHADISGAKVEKPKSAFAKTALYSDEALTAMAQEAEAQFEDYSTVSMNGVDLELPLAENNLDEAKRMTVKFTSGGALLILPQPKTGNGSLGRITAGTEVTVIAEYKDFYFFVADDGRMGWSKKGNFTS